MKRQHLIILVILVLVVGGAGLLMRQKESQSWNETNTRAGKELLGNLQVNDVVHIRIQGTNGEVNVAKTDDIWTVRERDQYPANFSKVVEVVNKLAGLKIIQPQNASEQMLARFQLLPPGQGSNSATIVELKDKDNKTLASVRLGKNHLSQSSGGLGGEWPDGRYVMLGEDLKSVALVKETLSDLEPRPEQWINKDFLKVEHVESVSVAAPQATNNWTVNRENETGEWKLSDVPVGKELDKTKVSALNSLLSSPYFNDIVVGKKPEELGFDQARVATIKTFDHFTYTVRVGNTNQEGNYYVQVEAAADLPTERPAVADEKPEDKEKADKEFKEKQDKLKEKLAKEQKLKKWTYIVSKWTIDPLLKNHADLLTDKKAEPPPAPKPPETSAFPDPTLPQPPSAPPPLPKEPEEGAAKPALPEKPTEPAKPAEEPKVKAPEKPEPAEPAPEAKPAEPAPKPEEKPEKPAEKAVEKPAEAPVPAPEPKPGSSPD